MHFKMSAQINRKWFKIPVDTGVSRCVSDIKNQAPRGPILSYLGFSKPFILETDASQSAIGPGNRRKIKGPGAVHF